VLSNFTRADYAPCFTVRDCRWDECEGHVRRVIVWTLGRGAAAASPVLLVFLARFVFLCTATLKCGIKVASNFAIALRQQTMVFDFRDRAISAFLPNLFDEI
jgi:hypothetical protein